MDVRLTTMKRAIYKIIAKSYIPPPKTTLGKGVHIGSNVYVDAALGGRLITIEDGATITFGVVLLVHDASSNRRINGSYLAPIKIGKRAFIGAHSIILPGVTIGADAIVGAGSVVTRDVEEGVIVAGNPARKIGLTKDLDERRKRMMTSMVCYSTSDKTLGSGEAQELVIGINHDGGGFYRSP